LSSLSHPDALHRHATQWQPATYVRCAIGCGLKRFIAAWAAHYGSVRIGVGVSTAPDARKAAVEAAEHARDELAGEAPSLSVLLASRSHTEHAGDILDAVQETVEPPALIGCIAQAIVAGRHEFEDETAVAVWLASGLAAETFQMDFVRTGSGALLAGYRFDRAAHDLYLLLPDPYTFPSNVLVEHLNTDLPGTTVLGGVVSGGLGPGDTRLFRDHDVLTSGAVGVRLPGMHGVPIVSQGCRPIGNPYIVTGAGGAVITELGGRPPLVRLREIVEGLAPGEQELVSHGLQIGIVVDEHLAAPGQGDFMIRGLLGADQSTGAIEIGDVVEVGATVQFQVRDAAGADKDLRLAVERAGAQLPGRPAGALLFTCNGRGRRMFGVADHDASTIENLLGGIPLAGFFAAGEIGPIAGRNALHGFTASMAVFVDDTD
jgi:small ligand-binding sensory domain FIST